MRIITGKTIHEEILSLDIDNNPVTGVTFETIMYRDGFVETGVTVNISVSDLSRGVYSASWSANTIGDYQLYAKNNITSVIFLSDKVKVVPDSEINTNVYIGL